MIQLNPNIQLVAVKVLFLLASVKKVLTII